MQAAVMPHPWKATQHRSFIEKVVLEDQGVEGRTWTSELRRDPEATGAPLAAFDIEVVTDDPTEAGNVVLYFKLTPEQTALLPRTSHWDVQQSYADDTGPVPLLKGSLETDVAVTRPEPA